MNKNTPLPLALSFSRPLRHEAVHHFRLLLLLSTHCKTVLLQKPNCNVLLHYNWHILAPTVEVKLSQKDASKGALKMFVVALKFKSVKSFHHIVPIKEHSFKFLCSLADLWLSVQSRHLHTVTFWTFAFSWELLVFFELARYFMISASTWSLAQLQTTEKMLLGSHFTQPHETTKG